MNMPICRQNYSTRPQTKTLVSFSNQPSQVSSSFDSLFGAWDGTPQNFAAVKP